MNERKILKTFVLGCLHQLFTKFFSPEYPNDSFMGCYTMDSKIIQLLIHGIVETGEYTLEGIASHTRIPFDVIFEAACGHNREFSITPWARIVNLYMQVKPEIAKLLFAKLLEIREENEAGLSLLLSEP